MSNKGILSQTAAFATPADITHHSIADGEEACKKQDKLTKLVTALESWMMDIVMTRIWRPGILCKKKPGRRIGDLPTGCYAVHYRNF